ncbi:MAG: lysophospholipid acyltransferase family protein, partial [Spirochaetales bacterium]|nr:lysophospholipid acyltransferase family protein [Spirochaetales bacterium]
MKKDIQVKDGRPGRYSRFLWHLGQFVARNIYNPKLNIKLENWDLLEKTPAPFLLVGNHVTNFDPVITSSNQSRLIHWVANDAVFRHPALRWAFRHIQVIPKTKGMSDLDTVRIMHKKVREGGIVGLYPEGQTSWDGVNQPMVPATPKLVKLLKVPVVAVVIKGGYISQPRWTWTKDLRKSRVVLEARILIQKDEIKKLSLHEIEERLNTGLYNDDFQFQRENPVKLKSEKRAETLELFTYICPKCNTMDALKSGGNDVKCQSCGWEFSIDEYGEFPGDSDFPFKSLHQWNLWQRKETTRLTAEYLAQENPEQPLLANEKLTILTGKGLVP